jgi:hypothetical protein
MTEKILLGHEVRTGKKVVIEPSHLITTGITQLSGKTTTLEALIKRSGLKAIVFKTKIGETGFSEGNLIPPYFKERSDWQYVTALLEATLKERLKFERSWIMEVCKNADSLLQIHNRIKEKLADTKTRGLSRGVYTTLDGYFEIILPQLQYANFSKTLTLSEGINIMDLERFKMEIQSLVIKSVLDEVLTNYKGIIVVIPEAWKYIPQDLGNPVKRTSEEFIRQGATNQNYLWIDSQDIAGVDKSVLKQVSIWILGLQTEINEVRHTLDQIPIPKRLKPKEDEIQTLKKGHFYFCSPDVVKKVYVQPAWLDEKTAKEVAVGKRDVNTVEQPKTIARFGVMPMPQPTAIPSFDSQRFYAKVQQDLVELRQDFFNKIQEQQQYITRISEEIMKLQTAQPKIDTNEIVSLVMQKIPVASVNKEEIISEVMKRVPIGIGGVVYQVAPLEKIKKGFLEETKNKILEDIKSLSDGQKKVLKFIESKNAGTNYSEILERCLFLSPTAGSNRKKISEACVDMANRQLIRKDTQNRIFPFLKDRIRNLLQFHDASEQEIEQVYNYILAELLK